jgi:hypothetical protein
MWLNYAKVTPEALSSLKKSPKLVEGLFFDSAVGAVAGFEPDKDVFGEDYRMITEVAEAMAGGESFYEQETWLTRAMGHGMGEEVAYEFCYGPGFCFSAEQVQQIANGLSKEDDPFGVSDFFAEAARQGRAVVGGVS